MLLTAGGNQLSAALLIHAFSALWMATPGEVPEWLKGTGCKPVGYAYAGSNPALSTNTPWFLRVCANRPKPNPAKMTVTNAPNGGPDGGTAIDAATPENHAKHVHSSASRQGRELHLPRLTAWRQNRLDRLRLRGRGSRKPKGRPKRSGSAA